MKTTTDFDICLGKKIEYFRLLKGLSRRELAEKLEITQQQLQKYEKGVNRITVSRLSDISKIINIPISKLINEKVYSTNHKEKMVINIMQLVNSIKNKETLLSLRNLILAFVKRA